MDDDDLTDDDRKDDLLGNHMQHILGSNFGLKPELKTSDCGVPLPPSKPKIWSLADTAACKTPPPPLPLSNSNGWEATVSPCLVRGTAGEVFYLAIANRGFLKYKPTHHPKHLPI